MNQRKAEARIQTWDEELRRNGSVTVSTSKAKILGFLVICLVFTVVCLGMTSGAGMYAVVGWIGIALFGVLGIPVMLWRLVTRGPSVTVTPTSVGVNDTITAPWTDVADIVMTETNGARMTSVVFRSEEAQRRALDGTGSRSVLRGISNDVTGTPELALPTGLKADPTVLGMWLAAVYGRFNEASGSA